MKQREAGKKLENTLINRAVVRTLLSDYLGAINDCEECLQLNPSNSLAYRRMGSARLFAGHHEEALRDLFKALDLGEPPSEIVPMIKDIIVIKEQSAAEAITVLGTYISPDSEVTCENYPLFIALIEAYIYEGTIDIAKSMLERIRNEYSNDPRYIITRAKIEYEDGNSQRFEELLLEACRNSPENNLFSLYLADFYYSEERFDAAIPFYEKFLEPTEIGPILTRYLVCLYYSRDKALNYPKCLNITRTIREVNGVVQVATEIEASIYDELGDLRKASELYQQLSEKFPAEYKHRFNHAMSDRSLRVSAFLSEETAA